MRIGVVAPQGWMAEYAGLNGPQAWERLVGMARQADDLGFDALWVFDHFLTNADRDNSAPTFESFATLTALLALTRRIRAGHSVICVAYRNPALTAKAISTIDVISAGRVELGLGAGWNESEFRAYGFDFPTTGARLERLRDSLEVISALLGSGRATFAGTHVRVEEAIVSPRGVQAPRIPIIVGGNGPKVTWRLAAAYADELNVDGFTPAQVAEAVPVVARHCEELGRDPASLRISVNVWSDVSARSGAERVDLIGAYGRAGAERLMFHLLEAVASDDCLPLLAEDSQAAGVTLEPPSSAP